ncbi:MAG TPA: cellulase family glycosylhydrolase, partial [Roseiflexaceae bacterium]|nr:cellulase family glycosylhydrolase [Roseiflexaceae bacterium]
MTIRYRHLFVLLLVVLLASASAIPVRAQSAVAAVHPNGAQLARPDGRAFFVLGYNYEGPADRAWQMWQRFDRDLIAADLSRARGGGANTVRIFVQHPLPNEIMAGRFEKLDTVIALAAQHDLYVLLTFYDYAERDLAKVAEVSRRIAERYRGNPTILAYDLRNEPQYFTLATAIYPAGLDAPLQRADMVPLYGERIARADLPAYRAGADGRILPAGWSDDQVYAYANNLAYFRQLIGDAERWAAAAPGRTVIDYLNAPDAARWQPMLATLNVTLRSWIEAQRRAIRGADPERMLTIGWSNLIFAGLPANGELLEFISLHRFPRPNAAAVGQTLDLGAALRRLFPNRPLLFEEVGFSTADTDPETAAILEMAITLRAYSEGYAGFLKWMLTDLPPVGNPREDNYGALRLDARPKPVFHTMGAFGTYLTQTAAPAGGRVVIGESGDGPIYTFQRSGAFYSAGRSSGGSGRMRLDAP